MSKMHAYADMLKNNSKMHSSKVKIVIFHIDIYILI